MKETNPCSEEFDCVIEAGKILMESGAEIYRVEETMRHMAASLEVNHFHAYVVNRGITASGVNCKGERVASVTSVPETNIHLGKIEAVNALSREIEQKKNATAEEVATKLQAIEYMEKPHLAAVLIAYFLGAGCFSYAIGSTALDSLCSAVIGLVMGLVLEWVGRYIKTGVLLTIIGSAVITVLANYICLSGIGEHRGLIILGTLMLLVPGATFTNSVREFSQNNHATGLTLLMSALLTCIAISSGVALTTDLLPFAEQMTSVFSTSIDSIWEVVGRTVMAGVGTVAFAYLFHAPKKYFLDLGILGAVSWMIYLLLAMKFDMVVFLIFVPALFAAVMSRILSVKRKCPITIFLSTSIFPLIPGLSFYRAIYFFMTGTTALAGAYIQSCFISAFAIALSIVITQEIRVRPKKHHSSSSSSAS
ncbi:MAG: threonine/serine exporter family protein [Eubacterium sp.]|nr:threonine/serine exporter family protein [Eubacterium sp.]